MRQTNEERSKKTRARLLNATVDCLIELGYARTTTTEIAKRADVSRGAQLHHFPTKAELVVAAVEHLFELRQREFVADFENVSPDQAPIDLAVDLLWAQICGPTYYAWLELCVAARTDPELRKSVHALSRRFVDRTQKIFAEIFGGTESLDQLINVGGTFVFSLLEGMAASKIVHEDELPWDEVLQILKNLLTNFFNASTSPTKGIAT